MHFFKQQQQQEDLDETIDYEKSEAVYKQQPVTPSAPEMEMSDDEMVKHVPMAIVVPIDSPSSSARGNQRPTASAHIAPSASEENQKLVSFSRVRQIPMLMVFHLGNFVLATTAFILTVTVCSLSIGLLPLCCLGVVVFQMTAWVIEYSAKLDIALTNLIITSDSDKLRVHRCLTSGFTTPDRGTLFAKLTFVSSQSIGAMVYFMTIKFAVGILSCIVAACVFGAPLSVIAGAAGVSGVEIVGLTFADNPLAYVFAAIGVFVVGVLLLRVTALLSWRLTQAACAEPLQDR